MKKDTFYNWLVDLVGYIAYPNRCCICSSVIRKESDICKDCEKLVLHVPQRGACPQCGRPKKDCFCLPGRFVSTFSAPLLYEGAVCKQLLLYKFDGRSYLARPYAKLAAQYVREQGTAEDVDYITYIPLGKTTFKYRQYNQAELFARELAYFLHLPCEETLYKTVDSIAQHELSAFFRKGNLVGIYDVLEEKDELIRGKTILLADDIATTGSTLQEAAKTLLLFGAKEVRGVCIARRNYIKKNER